MTRKYRPVGFQVLVELERVEKTTESGIVIATSTENDREQTGHDIGRIISFGPIAFKGFADCESPEQYGVKEGDLIEFNRYDGKIPRHDKEKIYRIINDSDVIAVIEEEL